MLRVLRENIHCTTVSMMYSRWGSQCFHGCVEVERDFWCLLDDGVCPGGYKNSLSNFLLWKIMTPNFVRLHGQHGLCQRDYWLAYEMSASRWSHTWPHTLARPRSLQWHFGFYCSSLLKFLWTEYLYPSGTYLCSASLYCKSISRETRLVTHLKFNKEVLQFTDTARSCARKDS